MVMSFILSTLNLKSVLFLLHLCVLPIHVLPDLLLLLGQRKLIPGHGLHPHFLHPASFILTSSSSAVSCRWSTTPTGAGARPPLLPPHSPAPCSPRPGVLLLGERDPSLLLSSTGSEEDEFNIVERLWIRIRREHGGCWSSFPSFSTHSFLTSRISHSPETPLVDIVVGTGFCLDSFD